MNYQEIPRFATQQTHEFWDTYSFEQFQEQFPSHHKDWKRALMCLMSLEEQYLGQTRWALQSLKPIDFDTYLSELALIVSNHQNPCLAVDAFVPLAEDKGSFLIILETALQQKNKPSVLKLLNKPAEILNELLQYTRGSLVVDFHRTVRDDGKHILNDDIPLDWFLFLNVDTIKPVNWLNKLTSIVKNNLDQPKTAQQVLNFIQNTPNASPHFIADMFNGFETVDNISKQQVVEVFQKTLLSTSFNNKKDSNSFINKLFYHFETEPTPLLKMLFSDLTDNDLMHIVGQYDFPKETIFKDLNFLLKTIPSHQHTYLIRNILSKSTQEFEVLNSALEKIFLQSSLMADTAKQTKIPKRKM